MLSRSDYHVQKMLVGKHEGKWPLRRHTHRGEDNVKGVG